MISEVFLFMVTVGAVVSFSFALCMMCAHAFEAHFFIVSYMITCTALTATAYFFVCRPIDEYLELQAWAYYFLPRGRTRKRRGSQCVRYRKRKKHKALRKNTALIVSKATCIDVHSFLPSQTVVSKSIRVNGIVPLVVCVLVASLYALPSVYAVVTIPTHVQQSITGDYFSHIRPVEPERAKQARLHRRSLRAVRRQRALDAQSSPERIQPNHRDSSRYRSTRNRSNSTPNSSTNCARTTRNVTRLGVVAIEDAHTINWPVAKCAVKHLALNHQNNFKCRHCRSVQWRGERIDCCGINGAEAMPPLAPIPPQLATLFDTAEFNRDQRKLNGLFSLTAMGAGSPTRRTTWAMPNNGVAMLKLFGRAYHRIFDVEAQYENCSYNVQNCSRYYVYDGELANQSQELKLNQDTVTTLRTHCRTQNRWCRTYKAVIDEILNSNAAQQGQHPTFIQFEPVTRSLAGPDKTVTEIAAVKYENMSAPGASRAVYVFPRNHPGQQPRFVPLWTGMYESMQYPLLFLAGESGWSDGHWREVPKNKSRTMSVTNQKVSFQRYCKQKLLSEPVFWRLGRVMQEYVCDMLSRMEEKQLSYMESTQCQKRMATYRTVTNAQEGTQVGKLLSKNFHGSPAKSQRDAEDGLAIVQRLGRPHLMITITCSPDDPLIKQNLLKHQTASDRPDLVSRAFRLKCQMILQDLKSGKIFGKPVYHMGCYEWQKRGLPHLHLLVRFEGDGPDRREEMDKFVWAQLPPKHIAAGRLRELVCKLMVHRACGSTNVNAPCMKLDKKTGTKACDKHYPQPYKNAATVNKATGRAEYRRPDNGDFEIIKQKIDGKLVDVKVTNRDIVPYNAYLTLKYECHICVDVVTSSSVVKYLYKYVTKGAAFARAKIGTVVNEIEQYRNARYISASEACWRLFGFRVLIRNPAVTLSHVHLENEHTVQIPNSTNNDDRAEAAQNSSSDLLKYFARPQGTEFDNLTMLDYYEQYTVSKPSNKATIKDGHGNCVNKRTKTADKHVSRLAIKTPNQGDVFYLRLLLYHRAARSFQHLRTVENTVHDSHESAARALGIVSGDEEFGLCMEEATIYRTAKQLRALFITLVLHGGPAQQLWETYKEDLIEDLLYHSHSADHAVTVALREFDLRLQKHGRSNEMVGLPPASHAEREYDRFMSDFTATEQAQFAHDHEQLLTSEQRVVYDTIIDAVLSHTPKVCMIDAPAGTGKTFTEKIIAARLRSQGKLVLIAASTGIAALQLPGGWTAHSLFKLPLEEANVAGCLCNIPAESQRAELLKKADLIIWDEVPMTHRFSIEALDLTLKDFLKNDQPFGGKIVVFSGDWRQVGPIVRFGDEDDTVDASLISSPIWHHVQRLRLTASQRDKSDQQYAKFVRDIGEAASRTFNTGEGMPVIPLAYRLTSPPTDNDAFAIQCTTDFADLISFVYHDILTGDASSFATRAILSSTNASIDAINDTILGMIPGERVHLLSSDSASSIDRSDCIENTLASPEQLNSLDVVGVPPHKLTLKNRSLIMITRNLNFSERIVNGQKAELLDISRQRRVLQVKLLDGSDSIVLLPRINFNPRVGRNGIKFKRVQFPVRVAYACTINKSQGQTLNRIGIDLRSNVFAHGQAYVAFSRARSRNSVRCLLDSSSIIGRVGFTTNVTSAPFILAATGTMPTTDRNNPPLDIDAIVRRWPAIDGTVAESPLPPNGNAVEQQATNTDGGVEESKLNWPPRS